MCHLDGPLGGVLRPFLLKEAGSVSHTSFAEKAGWRLSFPSLSIASRTRLQLARTFLLKRHGYLSPLNVEIQHILLKNIFLY